MATKKICDGCGADTTSGPRFSLVIERDDEATSYDRTSYIRRRDDLCSSCIRTVEETFKNLKTKPARPTNG